MDLVAAVGEEVAGAVTRFKNPLPSEVKNAAKLMYCGGAACEVVATQLGIGASTFNVNVKEDSSTICATLNDKIEFPSTQFEVARVMRGFSDIRGLPYCVGPADGTHVKWLACPDEQFYEYRCYKGYPSVVIFAVSTADAL